MNTIFQWIKTWLLKQPSESTACKRPEPRNQPEYDWQYLVTPGHVIYARMNHLRFIGVRLMIALVASFVVFHYSVHYAKNLIYKLDINEKHSTQRVVVDAQKVIYGSRKFQMDSRTHLTTAEELKPLITDNLSSLNASNKLSIPCNIATTITSPWVSINGSVEYPMCTSKGASRGKPKRVYMFAIVNNNGDFRNWIGIFYFDGTWKYKNLNLQGFYQVPKFDNFEPSAIVNTLKFDFADLPILTNKTEEYDYD